MSRADASGVSPAPVLRVARPTDHLEAIAQMYIDGLGFERLGGFEDHEGFDGVMVGHPACAYHLEFTRERGVGAGPAPGPEHLLVFYVPDEAAWRDRCACMEAAGFRPVAAHNPYWERAGRTFVDLDGCRVVIQRDAWTG